MDPSAADPFRTLVLPSTAELLRTLAVPTVIYDERFRVVAFNDAMARLMGCAPLHFAGQRADAFTLEEDWPALRRYGEQAAQLAPGGFIHGETRGRRLDGSVFVSRWHFQRLSDPRACWLSMISDVTEEEARVRQLVSRADRYHVFFEDSHTPKALHGPDWTLLEVNRAFCELVGRKREEIVGRDVLQVTGHDGLQAVLAARAGIESRLTRTYAVPQRALSRPDGSLRICKILGQRLPMHDGGSMVLVSYYDITDELSVRAELDRALRKQQAILETTSAGVLHAAEGRVLQANGALRRIIGVDLERDTVPDCPVRRQWACLLVEIAEALALVPEWRVERTLRMRDGPPRQCELQATLVDARAPAQGFILTAHDITALRALERRRLDEARRQRDVLVREVHHRIKNNLQGVAALMQQSARRHPQLKAELDEAAARLEALAEVHGLRVRQGERVGLRELLRSIVDAVNHRQAVRVRLEDGLSDTPALPEHEAVPIALVINELLTNAIKHAAGDSAPCVRLVAAGSGVRLSVVNAGQLARPLALDASAQHPGGLGLMLALLPAQGAQLNIVSDDGRVSAHLDLRPPVLASAG